MDPWIAILIIFGFGMAIGVVATVVVLVAFKLLPDTVEMPPEIGPKVYTTNNGARYMKPAEIILSESGRKIIDDNAEFITRACSCERCQIAIASN
jgi:hypothetical protein